MLTYLAPGAWEGIVVQLEWELKCVEIKEEECFLCIGAEIYFPFEGLFMMKIQLMTIVGMTHAHSCFL